MGEHQLHAYEELWFSIARIPWASLVLVPLSEDTPAGEIATSLAMVATHVRDAPVTAIVAGELDFRSARALAELQPRLDGSPPHSIEVFGTPVDVAEPWETHPAPIHETARRLSRAIVAIRPVMVEPLGVAIAQAADAVVLCFELGAARTKAARRTIELIGPERIVGAFLVRP